MNQNNPFYQQYYHNTIYNYGIAGNWNDSSPIYGLRGSEYKCWSNLFQEFEDMILA
jgi:hypothetical protein